MFEECFAAILLDPVPTNSSKFASKDILRPAKALWRIKRYSKTSISHKKKFAHQSP